MACLVSYKATTITYFRHLPIRFLHISPFKQELKECDSYSMKVFLHKIPHAFSWFFDCLYKRISNATVFW